jgi:hypothetical protein
MFFVLLLSVVIKLVVKFGFSSNHNDYGGDTWFDGGGDSGSGCDYSCHNIFKLKTDFVDAMFLAYITGVMS